MTPLDALGKAHCQVVTQVIKAKFTVRAIYNIRLVSLAAVHQIKQVQILTGVGLFKIHQKSFLSILGTGSHLQHTHFHPQ